MSNMSHVALPPAHPSAGFNSELIKSAYPFPARHLNQNAFDVSWATCEEDVHDAQRLRWQVFVQEMGARLGSHHPKHNPTTEKESFQADAMRDVDSFDGRCEHVLVRLPPTRKDCRGLVIGTYRLLPPTATAEIGDFYSATEFDLTPLESLRPRMAELGRACVHRDHRSGGVILALWGAVIRYTLAHRIDALLGSVSMAAQIGPRGFESNAEKPPLNSKTEIVVNDSVSVLWHWLAQNHLAESAIRVQPLCPFPINTALIGNTFDDRSSSEKFISQTRYARPALPALVKGYLACNAQILGPPAYDRKFGTADFPMLLKLQNLPSRHRRRFGSDGVQSV